MWINLLILFFSFQNWITISCREGQGIHTNIWQQPQTRLTVKPSLRHAPIQVPERSILTCDSVSMFPAFALGLISVIPVNQRSVLWLLNFNSPRRIKILSLFIIWNLKKGSKSHTETLLLSLYLPSRSPLPIPVSPLPTKEVNRDSSRLWLIGKWFQGRYRTFHCFLH